MTRSSLKSADSTTLEGDLLQVRDLSVSFDSRAGVVKAVDGVSFELARGRTLGLVGESGSGKSVLVRSMMGLLGRQGVNIGGSAKFDGTELVGAEERSLRKLWGPQLGMVFQDPLRSLNPVLTIERQITETVRAHSKMSRGAASERARALLDDVGIPDPGRRLRQYPHELSGGMRQRVTIALALACGPRLLFADEPTTALDVTVQAQILNLLQDQQSDRRMAMILVTHDLGVVAGRADEIAVMYAGQFVERAPTGTLFARTRMPYTEALLKSIPRLENPSHTRLKIIGGRPPDLITPPPGCRFAPRCPYAQPKCHAEPPPLVEAETPGHLYRCWYPVGTPAGRDALQRNLAHHVPAAQAAVSGSVQSVADIDAQLEATPAGGVS